MNLISKKIIEFLEVVQNIYKFLQLMMTILAIFVLFYWVIYQIPIDFFEGITKILGIIVEPLIHAFKAIFAFSTIHDGDSIDITPIILSACFLGIAFIFDMLAQITNIIAAKLFAFMDDLSFKVEENEKQYILNQIKKETLKFNKLHFHLQFSQANNDISELTEDMNKNRIKKTLSDLIDHAKEFDCYNTTKIGSDFSFVLSFRSKSQLINFINFIKEQIRLFNNEARMYGLNINYKGAIECTKEEENSEVVNFLRKIIRFCNKDEIMLSSLVKKFLEYDSGASLAFEVSGKGIYTTGSGTIELFCLNLIRPLKCKQY